MSPVAAPPSVVLPRESAVGVAVHDAVLGDVPGDVLLHDLTQLEVGDLLFSIAPPSRTLSLEVIVERDASLVLSARIGYG